MVILLYLKNTLYWPEDGRLRSKHVAIMRPECIYYITSLIYCCVLTVYYTLHKFVTTQRDVLCQIPRSMSLECLGKGFWEPEKESVPRVSDSVCSYRLAIVQTCAITT